MTANRNAWRFPFPVSVVRDATQERADHHIARCRWWKTELDAAEKKLRSEGLSFREQPVSGGNRLDAVIDPTLSGRVAECRAKIREHISAGDDYLAMLTGLARFGDDDTIELDADDIRHFGLAGYREEDDA